jgi:non-heme chloroperoxidase
MNSRITTSDGVTLNVADEGSGPVVVLVAGFTAPATTWVFQVDALVSAGYRTVCIDRRSHGESEAPAYGQRVARHGKDIHDVLSALELDHVVLVGSSMGASAIWAYLDLFGNARVRGVVDVDQTPRMINGDGWEHGFYGLTDANSGTLFAAGVPPTGRGLSLEEAMPAVLRLVDRLGPGSDVGGNLRPETLPLLRDHAQQDWRDVIGRVTVPQLFVAGRHSQIWPCEHAEAAAADNPLAQAVVIEHAGHAVALDQVDQFNNTLITFLEDL